MGQESLPIQVRSRYHNFDESITTHYDSGNAVLTAEWNALSLIIPPGEIFFIRSVQRLAPQARNPALQLQIKAFIGQEILHAKETTRSLGPLEHKGLQVAHFQDRFENWIRRLENIVPAKLLLAVTASIEHYTAVLSIWHLSTRYCDAMPPAFRDLIQWHGAEELEHKAVAFDLLKNVAPRNYLLRCMGFIGGMGVVWLWYRKALKMLLKFEGLKGEELRKERRRAREIRMPLLSLGFPKLLAYLRPGFHPNDLEDGNLGKPFLAEQALRANKLTMG